MKTGFRFTLLNIAAVLFTLCAYAQEQNPYIMNGMAVQDNCHCYTLTPDALFQAGSVWNKNKINLTQSFDYKFNVFLGCKDQEGADGIVFILQPIGTSIGNNGGGLGFLGVSPSIGIPIDTWQNTEFNDPVYDHISILKNGDIYLGTPNTLAGPVPVLANSGNIEDCQWHVFRIVWDATTKNLSAEVDGVLRVQTTIDMVKDIFNNDPEVYWGFSAATGGESNVQRFCTSLNPGYKLPANQTTCAPATLPFQDSSVSFGSILKWSWDFGDGSTFDGQTPPPHYYPTPGNYQVRLTILGNDGCQSDTMDRTVTIGSKPVAGFTISPKFICSGQPVVFTDASSVQYGTINGWNWNFNNGQTLLDTTSPGWSGSFAGGQQTMQLTVSTVEGCISDPFTVSQNVSDKPTAGIATEDACYGDPVHLTGTNTDPAVPIKQWYWFTGDGGLDSGAQAIHYYSDAGKYTVGLYAESEGGCSSDTLQGIVTIYRTQANAGNDTVVAFGQPLQLHGSGGELYQWSPADGLNDPNIADPIAVLYDNKRYVLTAYTSFGCPTYDTLNIKAYRGPDIYVPNAFTPDNNGHNDRFHAIAVGMTSIHYFNVYNRFGQLVYSGQNLSQGWDGTFGGQPQPTGAYVWIVQGEDYLGKTHTEK
ncbi:MAG TPA: PKD domain-containing protein, partial [Puia sp.]|nr:PKD domain-containing protein [Puia sp.]